MIELTGRIRFRAYSFLDRYVNEKMLVLQVEEQSEGGTTWRDATVEDLTTITLPNNLSSLLRAAK